MPSNRIPLFLVALACLLALAISARAQTNVPPRPQGGGIANRLMQGPDRAILNVMTDDQRASFQQALESQRERLRELESKMNDARKDLLGASASPTFDDNIIRTKAAAVARWEAELAVLRARALSQVKPPFSADQIERLKNSSPDNNFQGRQRPGGDGGNSSVQPKARAQQRDENDLPAAGKP